MSIDNKIEQCQNDINKLQETLIQLKKEKEVPKTVQIHDIEIGIHNDWTPGGICNFVIASIKSGASKCIGSEYGGSIYLEWELEQIIEKCTELLEWNRRNRETD